MKEMAKRNGLSWNLRLDQINSNKLKSKYLKKEIKSY